MADKFSEEFKKNWSKSKEENEQKFAKGASVGTDKGAGENLEEAAKAAWKGVAGLFNPSAVAKDKKKSGY